MSLLITPGQLASRSELFHQLSQVVASGIGLIGALQILQRNPPRASLRAPITRLLQQLAEVTGGKVLVAQNTAELPDVVRRLSAEIRSQYLLGYSSTNPSNDGKYRRVKVEIKPDGGPQLRASWRRGYYARPQ